MKDMRLSAPLWAWLGYALMLVGCAMFSVTGGWSGVLGVLFAAAFSFQFWTHAAYRGLLLSQEGVR